MDVKWKGPSCVLIYGLAGCDFEAYAAKPEEKRRHIRRLGQRSKMRATKPEA